MGENRLFATLDTTVHQGVLPSRIKVIFADTIGFIVDLPVQLFASFSATLRHIQNADLLIHVQDLSHPNVLAQRDNVLETLLHLNIPMDRMISVGNKTDKITHEQMAGLPPQPESVFNYGDGGFSTEHPPPSVDCFDLTKVIPVSCRTGNGLPILMRQIDFAIQKITGSRPRRLRLAIDSYSIDYLYQENLVTHPPEPSECGRYLIFDVCLTDAQMTQLQLRVGTKLTRSARR